MSMTRGREDFLARNGTPASAKLAISKSLFMNVAETRLGFGS